tara:strand:- start:8797 stop:9324 length:528 start_codon:yes stop_codon:yes gene_type:complete
MNIFVLDRNPRTAAYMMCDKHVVKMILESAQMLSAVIDYQYKDEHRGGDGPVIEQYGLPGYPKAHAKHPCTLWARASKQNSKWLVQHMRALCLEYFIRYQKFHKMDGYPLIYDAQLEHCEFEQPCQTEFVQAITNTDHHREDPVEAYREYYRKEKAHFCTWKHGDIPEWFSNDIR